MSKENDGKNQILEYIKFHGVVDKDASLGKKVPAKKIQIRKGVCRTTLDLHGMKSLDARRKILFTFENSRNKGIKEILIIHGRGFHSNPNDGPVLKTLVMDMLENELRSLVQSFKMAPPRDGGEGATVVVLR